MKKENIEDIYRLSPIQHGMLFHSLYAPESGVYFEQFLLRRGADFRPDVFEQAWHTLVEHHPVLRTSFFWANLKDPIQIVHRKVEIPFDRQDWRHLSAREQEQRLREYMAEDRRRGFDLTAAPLLRFAVLRLADDSWKIVWSYHHLLLDGWSLGILFREFPPVYLAISAGTAGAPVQLTKRRPFRDYIAWLRRQDMTEAEAYWRRTLAGFTTPTPLVVDRPASPAGTDPGRESRSLRIPEAETAEIKAWCQRRRLTVSTLAHGAWALLLSRYSQERDVLFGSTLSGRPASLPGAEAMLGCFINTLPVRVQIPPEARVLPFLQELQTRLVELRRYEHSPLVDVQGWSEMPRPAQLFQSIVVVEGFLENTTESSGYQRTNYPLNLVVGPDREMLLRIDYDAAHFDAGTIDRLLGHLRTLVAALPRDPERRLEDLPVFTPPEREQLLAVWNRPDVRFDVSLPLHRLFEARVAETPGAVAVTCEGASLTYGELNARANQLARHLRRLGVGPESRVGLCVDRSFEQVEGILGILKAGGAYVPLDPRYPSSRLSLIAEDSGLDVLVTVEALRELVRPVRSVICLDTDAAEIATESAENPDSGAGPGNLAYVIYTSGSTGRPKGSLLTHANVTRLMAATDAWFHFGPEDVWSLFHSFAFDFSVWEIWGALLYGGRLVVVPYWVSRSPASFRELLVRERVTVLNQTPSAFRQLVQADLEATEGELELKWVVFGGEALELASLAPWFDKHGDRRPVLVNMYGITETAVHVTCREVTRADLAEAGRSPIGVPIPDLRVHLVDASVNLVPVGVPGEMLIGGAGVARGYLGRPDLTAERFIPDPFGAAGERLYRSGDLARRLPGGELEYLGRIDHQVKIRGFRIELGEIEAVLASHPGVREAVVLARQDAVGDRRLVAWVVPRASEDFSPSVLRAFLQERLPDYMVPAAMLAIPAVPLTAHGKVDRKALPDPAAAMPVEKGFDPPRPPIEELIAGIWAEILGVERIGRKDSFFELGGHSLLAVRALSRLRDTLQVDLPLRALFDTPVLGDFASCLAKEHPEAVARLRGEGSFEERDAGLMAIEPGGWREGEPLPLSFAQERLWFFEQMEPGSPVYHIPSVVRLSGRLDAGVLAASLGEAVRRHASLRTTFLPDGGRPVQIVSAWAGFHLPVIDLSGLLPELREMEARSLARGLVHQPFDLQHGPLLRTALLRLEVEEHAAVFVMHHIVSDGWSIGVLTDEVTALYGALSQGRPSPLAELSIQYPDYALWQRRWLRDERLAGEISFWKETLAGAPVLELPADRSRPPLPGYRGGREPFAFPAGLLQSLAGLGRAGGATPFMVLLAAFAALLDRYSGQEDVSIGSPVANRNRSETEPLIGFLVNTLVFRLDLSGGAGFRELLERVRRTALAAYAHQELPFERVVEEVNPRRDLSLSPLFQVMLLVQDGSRQTLDLPGLRLSPMSLGGDLILFDLTLSVVEAPSGLLGTIEYSSDLFDPATAERMAGHFRALLAGAAAEPGRRLSELPLLTAAELAQLAAWSRAEGPPWEDLCLHEMIEARCDRDPDAVAVVDDGGQLSYGELEERSNRLAHRLRRLGVGPEVRVGHCMQRSLQGVVGILGILKAGGVYLPVDPSYPRERRSWILADAGARVLVTQESLRHDLAALPAGTGVEVLCLDSGWAEIAGESAERPERQVRPDNVAYAIYTSGSTGKPKGVEVPHGAVAAYVRPAMASYGYGDHRKDRVLQTSSWGFDASIEEVLVSLAAGVTVALWDGDLDPEELLRRSMELGVTALALAPSFLQLWAREVAGKGLPDLPVNVVVTGGEALSPEVARLWPSTPLRNALLVNAYGPTEAVIVATDWAGQELPEALSSVPIGRPRSGRSVHVLDPQGEPVPVGVPGELFLGGSLARGYLGRPEATAERFVPDGFSGEPGSRLYRTGDRARWLPSGDLDFLGRTDHQVKIRGFRIELGEVEAALASHPGVGAATVTTRQDPLGGQRLVAYVVPAGEGAPSAERLRDHLAVRLPEYMVPSLFVLLEELPLTTHGKVDRKALPAPDDGALVSTASYVAPRTPTEERLAEIWAGLLSRRAGAEDDFFRIGGHSLLATQLVSRIREGFGIELPLRQVFERPTLEALALEIEAITGGVTGGGTGGEAAPPLRPVPRPVSWGETDLPLSFAQERLWFLDRFQPGSAVYNLPTVIRLIGALDFDVFLRSLAEIVRRHESLRTRFAVHDSKPIQVIEEGSFLEVPVIDLRALPAGRREAAARVLAMEESLRPFDLAEGPLLRVTLLRSMTGAGEDEHVVLLMMHHIVTDGWSMAVFVNEFGALYQAFSQGAPSPLPELPIQYADYALWQRAWLQGDVLEEQLSFWRETLTGAATLELPADRPRPPVQTFRGAAVPFLLPDGLVRSLEAAVHSESPTRFMILTAALSSLLSRYSGQEDVSIGSPIANRTRAETEPLIGFFANTLVTRTDLAGNPGFRGLLGRVREAALAAYAHQDLPFERVVEEVNPSGTSAARRCSRSCSPSRTLRRSSSTCRGSPSRRSRAWKPRSPSSTCRSGSGRCRTASAVPWSSTGTSSIRPRRSAWWAISSHSSKERRPRRTCRSPSCRSSPGLSASNWSKPMPRR